MAATLPENGVGATVFGNGSQLDVFYRGSDSGIWETSYTVAAGWTAASEIPGTAGTAVSAPAVDVYRSGAEIDVFYTSTDGGIDEVDYTDASGWSGAAYELPGTAGTAASAPAVDVYRGGAEVDVFYTGADGGIMELYFNDSWTTPVELPGTAGTAASAPTADVYRSGAEVDVFYTGTNGGIEELDFNDSWTTPGEIPGTAATAASAPSAVVYDEGSAVDVFYRGTDGGIRQIVFDESWSPSPYEVPGTAGTAASAPAAVVYDGGSELDVFYMASSNALLQIAYSDAGGWSGPLVPQPVVTTPSPTTVTPPAPSSPSQPASHSRPRVRVKLTIAWVWNRLSTRVRGAHAFRFPAQARIALRCDGRGCPRQVLRAGRRQLPSLWRALERPTYRPGDTITITITQPEHLAERAQIRIRAGAEPSVHVLR